MNCDCKDWQENIEKVTGPMMLLAARSGFRVQYGGVTFRFCPWCSKPLQESEADSVPHGLKSDAAAGASSETLAASSTELEEIAREAVGFIRLVDGVYEDFDEGAAIKEVLTALTKASSLKPKTLEETKK